MINPANCLRIGAFTTPNGALVRRCFRILSAKNIGLTITLADDHPPRAQNATG